MSDECPNEPQNNAGKRRIAVLFCEFLRRSAVEFRSVEVRSDIARLWNASPDQDAALADEAYLILDRATALRRANVGQPEWAVARLAEGLSRFMIARQMAQWGHRSYAIQALEASLDALRDAAASLPDDFDPSRDAVFNFRENLHREWRAAQSEENLGRLAALTIGEMR